MLFNIDHLFALNLDAKQFYLTHRLDSVPTLWVRVDLGAMTIKEYSVFPKALVLLKPHYQIVSYRILDTHLEDYPCAEMQ